MAIEAGETGKCPHCGVTNRFEATDSFVYGQKLTLGPNYILARLSMQDGPVDTRSELLIARCSNPECRLLTLLFNSRMILPLSSQRPPAPAEVPESVASDYKDACLVEPLSAKAAAALARRCLQNLLNDKGITGTRKHDLSDQIDEAITKLPADLAESIDTIRVVGNFAAHPNKSTSTGEIVAVEPGEAEYTIDILYELFDYYYVRPARSKAKKAALQAKLKAAGSSVKIK